MPRFVILAHDHPVLHWDLMLEAGATLRTWRLAQAPAPAAPASAATALADHRLAYLDYEGPVSGNRGTVQRWDRGTYALVTLSTSELIIDLHGERMQGRARLQQVQRDEWTFTLE